MRTTLTNRETAVLHLVAKGLANKQIASKLGISIKTVEKHRERMYRTLNVHSTVELLRVALKLNLVSMDE